MPRVPKYRKHPRGYAFVECGGKRRRLPGDYNSPESLEAYTRFLDSLQRAAKHEMPPLMPGETITTKRLIAHYLLWAADYYANDPTEIQQLRYAAAKMLAVASRLPAARFGPLTLRAVRDTMIDAGWSRGYINHQIGRVRRIFRWGVEHELVPPSVLDGLRAVQPLRKGKTAAPDTEPRRPVEDAHVDAVLPELTPQVRAMVEIQRLTGMRPSNVLGMTGAQINTESQPWIYTPIDHKSEWRGRLLRVPLGPRAQAILAPFLADRPPAVPLFSPAEAAEWDRARRRRGRQTPMTPSHQRRAAKAARRRKRWDRYPGDQYAESSYCRAIARAIVRVNGRRKAEAEKVGRDPVAVALVKHWSPYQLRHAFATLIRQQYGLEAAQAALGHASADITEIYAQADLSRAIEIAKTIG